MEELKELNETKTRLIEEEELEEAIRYRDLIKNKEKELVNKEILERFLSFYESEERRDYRLGLLEELRDAEVSNRYVKI